MLYLLDTANVKEIEDNIENYPVSALYMYDGILLSLGEINWGGELICLFPHMSESISPPIIST